MATYKELQDNFVDLSKLKVGDTVKVLRAAKRGEMGWGVNWHPDMTKLVGKGFEVREITKEGIGIETKDNYWVFPVFVLQKTKDAPALPKFKLSSEYTAEVQKDGSVKCGCQAVPYGLLKEIYEAAKKVHDSV